VRWQLVTAGVLVLVDILVGHLMHLWAEVGVVVGIMVDMYQRGLLMELVDKDMLVVL
jgi:hypothetical protein